MKAMKKILSIMSLIAIVVSALTLTGCGKDDKKNQKPSIVGEWKVESEEGYDFRYVFNDDGTGKYVYSGSEIKFTYEDKGDKVVILFEGNTVESELEYRVDGNSLIIKNSFGQDVKYNKQ